MNADFADLKNQSAFSALICVQKSFLPINCKIKLMCNGFGKQIDDHNTDDDQYYSCYTRLAPPLIPDNFPKKI